MTEIEISYRCNPPALPPRPIKLQIPGWAGIPGHNNGDKPQPWHCVPWVEGNTYGLELIYPFDTEAKITKKDGKLIFDTPDLPFKSFADEHYGYNGNLDIKVPDEYVLRLEPHPRYFVDNTGTVPLLVPGHLQTQWWARFFFIVFKSPFEGQTHIFRKGEGYGQILIVPSKSNYKLRQMTTEEYIERQQISEKSMIYDTLLSDKEWIADSGLPFNDKYKVLARAYAKNGEQGIEEVYEKAREKGRKKLEKPKGKKFARKIIFKKS